MNRDESFSAPALVVLGLLIGASALAFGSVEIWAGEWLRFGAVLAVVLAAWSRGARAVFGGESGRLALPIALLVLWGLVQTVPLPSAVVRALAPRVAETHARTVPETGGAELPQWLVEQARGRGITVKGGVAEDVSRSTGEGATGRTLSLYPFRTRRAALGWITALLFFFAGHHLARSLRGRYLLLWTVAGWSGLMGLLAVIQELTSSRRLLWLRDRPAGTNPLGPFVNPSHFAGYVEMGTLVGLGLLLALLSRPEGRLTLTGIRQSLLDRHWSFPRLLILAMLLIPAAGGLALSRSEGALIALASGLLVLAAGRRWTWVPLAAVALAVVVGLGVGVLGLAGPDVSDLETAPLVSTDTSPSLSMRVDVWAKTLRIFVDHPLTGTGLGTFPWAIASYQRSGGVWNEAHNDYLQLLAETGLVGALLLVWSVAGLLRAVLHRNQQRPLWTTVGAAAAVVAMLVHTIGDFNLQIPSNGALFAVLLGVWTAAERREDREVEADEA